MEMDEISLKNWRSALELKSTESIGMIPVTVRRWVLTSVPVMRWKTNRKKVLDAF